LAIAALSEIIMFMYSKSLVHKVKTSTFMLIAAVGMIVAPMLAYMIDSALVLVMLGVLNLFTFAPMAFGAKRMVDDLAEAHVRTTTQTTTLAIQTAVVTVGLSLNGLIISSFSVNGSYIVQGAIALIAVGLVLVYRRLYNH